MKKIKIFVGSSIVEFEEERKDLELFIRRISDSFEDNYEIKLAPYFCENVDDAMSKERLQNEYNKLIADSFISVFLFFNKVGKYTKEEFMIANELMNKNSLPKVLVYFKKSDNVLEDVGNFMNEIKNYNNIIYGTFTNIDTVKLRILLNLKLTEMNYIDIKAIDNSLLVDNEKILDLNNINEFINNKELQKLKEEYIKYNSLSLSLQNIYDSRTNVKEYIEAKSKALSLKKNIDYINNEIINISLMFYDNMQHGLSIRLKKAYELFEAGEYFSALAILNSNDIDDEYMRSYLVNQNKVKLLIDECLFSIELLKNNNGLDLDIEEKYQKIIPYILKFDVHKEVIKDYYDYLISINKHDKANEIKKYL